MVARAFTAARSETVVSYGWDRAGNAIHEIGRAKVSRAKRYLEDKELMLSLVDRVAIVNSGGGEAVLAKENVMTELQTLLKPSIDFVENTSCHSTLTHPSPYKHYILAARDGVFVHAVRSAIVFYPGGKRDRSGFQRKNWKFDASAVDLLLGSNDPADCIAFADRVIRQYGSAESFVKHLG